MNSLFVMFKVGNADYVIPASSVLELESFTTATEVPGAPRRICAGFSTSRAGRAGHRSSHTLWPFLSRAHHRHPRRRRSGRVAGGRSVVDARAKSSRSPATAFRPPPDVIAEQTQGFVQAIARSRKAVGDVARFSKSHRRGVDPC